MGAGPTRPGSFPESADDPQLDTEHRVGKPRAHHGGAALALAAGALGVVFGDIGTSPLYALQATFTEAVTPDRQGVYGVISLVFWAITLIVSVKYVTFIMRADNEGEGGIMALIARVQTVKLGGRAAKMALIALGIFGASLFYGDGMITPAISVLSAVEGLKVAAPALESLVVEITLVIITVLFLIQRFGTGAVGRLFGPVMGVWFTILAVAGAASVVHHPGILRAVSPTYGASFLVEHGGVAFAALGSVVLTVTGAAALYADMGHFGRTPIRRAWFAVVFPALILNYMGQGALILREPGSVENPFFLLFPGWSRMPMVLLATMATVIASQAVISGAFSVTRQAVQLGFLPRLRIMHTSGEEIGQVYVPWVNWALLAAVLTLVFAFESSARLASAYGVAVTGTIAITTLLFFAVAHLRFGWSLRRTVAGATAFAIVDLAFLGANLPKLLHGGWLPLLVAAGAYVVLTTWQEGRRLISARREEAEGPLDAFIADLHAHPDGVARVPGTAVFLNRGDATTPLAMRANVVHNHSLHQHAVIVSLETLPRPRVPADERLLISDLGYADDGILHITARFGFQDDPRVPDVLRAAVQAGLECPLEVGEASYFLSKIELVLTDTPGMARWRKRVFLATSHLAT